jgi:TfoX/Sxy family transcriptional regulator of competence genes
MFGEYGLWCDGKLVALICNDQLFVKETRLGCAMMDDPVEAPPYPGAKPSLVVEAERWEDHDWLANLIQKTASELPIRRPKRRTKS